MALSHRTEGAGQGILPVSYTHLDVYKRQCYNSLYLVIQNKKELVTEVNVQQILVLRTKYAEFLPIFISVETFYIRPHYMRTVSYTHLVFGRAVICLVLHLQFYGTEPFLFLYHFIQPRVPVSFYVVRYGRRI